MHNNPFLFLTLFIFFTSNNFRNSVHFTDPFLLWEYCAKLANKGDNWEYLRNLSDVFSWGDTEKGLVKIFKKAKNCKCLLTNISSTTIGLKNVSFALHLILLTTWEKIQTWNNSWSGRRNYNRMGNTGKGIVTWIER